MYIALNKYGSRVLNVFFEVFHNSLCKYYSIFIAFFFVVVLLLLVFVFFFARRNCKRAEFSCYIILTSYMAS